MGSGKLCKRFYFFGFVQRQHGSLMPFLGKLVHCFISYGYRRTPRQHDSGLLLQRFQFIVESVIFQVAHKLPVFLIISLCCFLEPVCQLLHAFHLIHKLLLLSESLYLFPQILCFKPALHLPAFPPAQEDAEAPPVLLLSHSSRSLSSDVPAGCS